MGVDSDYQLLNRGGRAVAPGAGCYRAVSGGKVGPSVRMGVIDSQSRVISVKAPVQGDQVFPGKYIGGLGAAVWRNGMVAGLMSVHASPDGSYGSAAFRPGQPTAALSRKSVAGFAVNLFKNMTRYLQWSRSARHFYPNPLPLQWSKNSLNASSLTRLQVLTPLLTLRLSQHALWQFC